jgi:outer membrane protein OmpA-like peptidoglycan-associated protein
MNKISLCTRAVFLNATLASAALLLAACAADAVEDPGASKVRADLSAIQANPNLANRAPIAMQEAAAAVHNAEVPDTDAAQTGYLVYIADRKVQIAKSLAQAQYAEDQRKSLSAKSDQMRLDARTHEADAAHSQADAANSAASAAQSKNDELVAQLAALNAKKTERGIELTLGDVLFSSGRAELKAGGAGNLDKLVVALADVPARRVMIEGYTDSQGGEDMNMALSQRRADAVSLYLTGHGIDAGRITATGKGQGYPVAGNETAEGRQLNRRVQVTIQDAAQ